MVQRREYFASLCHSYYGTMVSENSIQRFYSITKDKLKAKTSISKGIICFWFCEFTVFHSQVKKIRRYFSKYLLQHSIHISTACHTCARYSLHLLFLQLISQCMSTPSTSIRFFLYGGKQITPKRLSTILYRKNIPCKYTKR